MHSLLRDMHSSAAQSGRSPRLTFSCRLPVESAKKLRWYDNADLAKMSVQHVREKHMLLDTITALKKVTACSNQPARGLC
jgi:hypothetical protein